MDVELSHIPLVKKDTSKEKKDKKKKKKEIRLSSFLEEDPASIGKYNEFVDNKAKREEAIGRIKKLKQFVDFPSAEPEVREDIIKKLLLTLETEYPEIAWLRQDDVNETPEMQVNTQQKKGGRTFSQIIASKDDIEFNKTVLSICCLLWCADKTEKGYKNFTYCQFAMSLYRPLEIADFKVMQELVVKFDENYPELMDSLVVMLILKHLAKVDYVVQTVRAETGVEEIDPAKLISKALTRRVNTSVFRSFGRVSELCQLYIRRALTEFIFAQFVQSENLPVFLKQLQAMIRPIDVDQEKDEFKSFDKKLIFDLFGLVALFDMAGAAPGASCNGSYVMNGETYADYKMAMTAIYKFASVNSALDGFDYYTDIYSEYLHGRGAEFDLNAYNCSNQRAILRLCCMARCHKPLDADIIKTAYSNLPIEAKQLLRRELSVTGNEDEGAIFLYYSPALLNNAWKVGNKTNSQNYSKEDIVPCIEKALQVMARCFQVARANKVFKPRSDDKVITANINGIASHAKSLKALDDMLTKPIIARRVADDLVLQF